MSVVDRSDDVDLTVRNEGTIPAEALPRIFEPFQQGYAKRKSGGLGLGLYIVDQIVLAHGGAVTVTTSGAATAFSVRLSKRSTTPLPA